MKKIAFKLDYFLFWNFPVRYFIEMCLEALFAFGIESKRINIKN